MTGRNEGQCVEPRRHSRDGTRCTSNCYELDTVAKDTEDEMGKRCTCNYNELDIVTKRAENEMARETVLWETQLCGILRRI